MNWRNFKRGVPFKKTARTFLILSLTFVFVFSNSSAVLLENFSLNKLSETLKIKKALAAPPDGLLFYSSSAANTTPQVRTYTNGAPGSFSGASTLPIQTAANSTGYIIKAGPTRPEYIAGVMDNNNGGGGNLDIYRFSATSTSWNKDWVVSPGINTISNKRSFDIAYEETTGRAMVVYSNNTANPQFRIWDGSTWSAAQSITVARTTGIVHIIKLASRMGSNEIAIGYEDANSDLNIKVWRPTSSTDTAPSSWVAEPASLLDGSLASITVHSPFDLAFERSSGDLEIFWTRGLANGIFSASLLSGGTAWATNAATGAVASLLELDADPDPLSTSNNIAVCARGGVANVECTTWTGAGFSNTSGNLDSQLTAPGAGGKSIAVGWAGNQIALATYIDKGAATVQYVTSSNGGAWNAVDSFAPSVRATGDFAGVNIVTSKVATNKKLMLLIADKNFNLRAFTFDGTTTTTVWGEPDGGSLGVMTSTVNAVMDFAWDIFVPLPTTTLADGTDPGDTTVAPGSAITDIDAFTLVASEGTDSVTGLTVTLTGANSFASLSEVRITSDNGATLYFGAVANPASNTVVFSAGTPIPVTTTATQFKVRITPKTHANMPVPPGLAYSVGGTITSFTSTNIQAGTDATTPATITVDNLSPSGATAVGGLAGDTKNTVNWTTSSDADFNTTSGSVVYRWTSGTAGAEVPAEGSTTSIGGINGTATTACVVSSALSTALSKIDGTGGSAECTTTALTNGQAYTYKVFQKDTSGNYDVGVLIGTFTPAVGITVTGYTNGETALNYSAACTGCGARIGGGAFAQTITITGTGFGADPGVGNYSSATNNIKVGTHQIATANVTSWSATQIIFTTNTATAGEADTNWGTVFGGTGANGLVVTAGGGSATGLNFYVFPQVTSVTTCDKAGFPVGSGGREYDATDAACPNGLKDGQVKLVGTRFGTGATGGWVRILGCDVTTCASPTGTVNVDSWANELIQVQVPTIIADTVNSGSLIVQQGAGSGFKTHTYTASGFLIFPRITGFTPTSASEGSSVAVDGNHFCQTGTCPTVFLGGTNDVVFTSAVTATTFTTWTATAMTTAVPAGAVTGNVVLKSNSNASNAKSFSVLSNTPADPTALGQWTNSGLTLAIAVGGAASTTPLYLSQVMEVPGITGGTLYPQFEYQLIGTAFGCGAGVCAGATTGVGWPGAGPTTGTTSISVADDVYHWQARTKHTKTAVDYYSAWVPFGANVETATDFQKDTTAPAVTGVSSGTPGTNTATITWNTSGETSTTRIEYDTAGTFTGGYDCASTAECTALVATLVNAHSVALSNLNSGTTYHYRVRSKDAAGNETIDPPTGDYTFTTSSTLSPSKTTRFHIVGNTASISGASNSYTFSVHMPENATTTRSAFVELKGIFLVGGTPAIDMKVNNAATSTYAFPSGSRYSLKILHPVSSVNISPATNTLTIAPGAGNGFYVSSADIYVNYTYTP